MIRLRRFPSRFAAHGALAIALLVPFAVMSAPVTVVDDGAPGPGVERHINPEDNRTPWLSPAPEGEQGDKVETRRVKVKDARTIKLQNVVPPIRFGSGDSEIPPHYVGLIREALERVKGRANVRLHFVGYTDNQQLHGRVRETYGDNQGLSRERAGNVAEFFKKALNLPAESIAYEGRGETNPVASNATNEGRNLNRRVEIEVWYDEITENEVDKEVVIAGEINRVKVCRVETVCKLRYKEGHARRARIKNLVAPLRFSDENLAIPETFLQAIRQSLADLGAKQGVVMKFVGYTDNTPLAGREERLYGTSLGLSKARARRAALAVQDALKLPASAIDADGKGAAFPIASNDSDKGRALNRRVEVEFWYDDALQQLSDEPQLCPEAAGAETVTRAYVPPSGGFRPILVEEGGKLAIEPGLADRLRNAMADIQAKANVRLRFIGYTSNERLDRRTTLVYGDDIGLSAARARRAMESIRKELGLAANQAEFEGRGYVQSTDVVNTGFVEEGASRVEVEVVYDELAALDEGDGLEINRLTREVTTRDPLSLNAMRITVDGKPIDDPGKAIADIQRCTDVAMQQAQLGFKFDNLNLKPRLNVTAWPTTFRYRDDPDTEFPDNLVRFRTYSNYAAVIARAEVRLFEAGQSTGAKPLAVVAIDKNGEAEWQADFSDYSAPGRELQYVLRVYGHDGHFDETRPQSLWVVEKASPEANDKPGRELLVGHGENRLGTAGIPKRGGTIEVRGQRVPPGHTIWVAGRAVPVSEDGKFVAEEILPSGLHTVEVAVLDANGNGQLYLRDLELKRNDWFYVGIADLTLAKDNTSGPASLVTQDTTHYNNDLSLDGRLAFYANGKFGNGWGLTTSADTLEGPVDSLFSNFLDKRPDALFRRIDPNYYFPTYGDDGKVEEGAPTLGKFYLRLNKDENYGLWGNFRISYLDNSLAHVDRGLYGANLHTQAFGMTSFGEKRFVLDGFAAEPGTIAGRDEFLGTGGSLYYLRHQDILTGSDRVRIEIRDRDSGLVVSVKNLTPVLDYSLDPLQGRIVLAQPLLPVAADNMLISGETGTGHLAYLVVRYEYSPGFSEFETVSTGGHTHLWIGDHMKIGVTADRNTVGDDASTLSAGDLTLRKNSDTWLKVSSARSTGPGLTTLTSSDGGFNFTTVAQPSVANLNAGASRVDTSIGFGDIVGGATGRLTLYRQELEAGYSAPGLVALTQTEQVGGTLRTPLTSRLSLNAKFDRTTRELGLSTSAAEVNLGYQFTRHWLVSAGARSDSREDKSPVIPVTQMQGDRTDAVLRATYDSKEKWLAYGFMQDTLSVSGNREENGRLGAGGSYRFSERFKLNAEASSGDLGSGGRLGTEYLYSDRTNLYLTYVLDNEVPDTGLRATRGNMVSGVRSRFTDTTSIYAEERYTHGDVPTGLTHAAGVDLAPFDHWTFGVNADSGTLIDPHTSATSKRNGLGTRVGYGSSTLRFTSAIEFRTDNNEMPDGTVSERNSWLFKNGLRFQFTPSTRLIAKLNHAVSTSSLGASYDGKYTEAVAGLGYRPVDHDRLNTLFKYTYFYNLPGMNQVTGTGTAVDYIQKSHIASLDAVYDLTRNWSVGAKYAYRLGQAALDRINPEFFDSSAQLMVLRVDWQFLTNWDAIVEARTLDLVEAGDRRSGFLVGGYRRFGDHIKAGIGYNFTDFSDDLTQLGYTSQGFFINILGKL